MIKLTDEQRTTQATILAKDPEALKSAQVTIYVMIGGGLLASFAIEQPGDFYIDTRASILPYPKRSILQAVAILAEAYKLGNIPSEDRKTPRLLNLGEF